MVVFVLDSVFLFLLFFVCGLCATVLVVFGLFLFFWLGLPFFGVFSECFCLESLILAQDER